MFTVLYRTIVSTSKCDATPQTSDNTDITETLYEAERIEFHPRGSRCDYDMLELFFHNQENVNALWLNHGDEAYVMNASGKTIAKYRGRLSVGELAKCPKPNIS